MKKSMLIGMAAAALFAGCNQAEIVEQNPENAISFGTSFVNNMTKVTEQQDFSTTNLPKSSVFGVMQLKGSGEFVTAFNNTTVDENGTYNPKQYWQKGANYWFEAFAPAESEVWSFTMAEYANLADSRGTLSFDNKKANGEVDLLAAVPVAITDVAPGSQEAVQLNLQHQLSRVKVKFVNQDLSSAYNFVFDNVKITNAVQSATMNIDDPLNECLWEAPQKSDFNYILKTSEVPEETRTNSAGPLNSVTTEHIYLIPDQTAFTVSFTVTMYQNDAKGEHFVTKYDHVIKNVSIPEMTKGNSYILTATITEKNVVPVDPDDPDTPVDPDDQINYIEFEVGVEDWADWNEENTITVPDTPVVVVP